MNLWHYGALAALLSLSACDTTLNRARFSGNLLV